MAAAVQINGVDNNGGALKVTGFIVLTGSYPTGGDVLNFATAIADASFQGILPAIISSCLQNIDVWSMNGAAIGSNYTSYNPACTKAGTPPTINPATGIKLKCAALGTVGTEHSAATYESQYLNDIIAFMAVFTRQM